MGALMQAILAFLSYAWSVGAGAGKYETFKVTNSKGKELVVHAFLPLDMSSFSSCES
jgi:hypothetical protein